MIYLDNAATTRPHPEVLEATFEYLKLPPANPSAVHPWGIEQRRVLSQARSQLARLFSIPQEGVVFCASGTESDNLAIKGSLVRLGKNRGTFVTTPLEHKAVLECAKWYQDRGGEVRFVQVDPASGLVNLDDLKSCIDQETCLISVSHVHNETGITQDLTALSKVIKAHAPQAIFHSDGVQGFGKLSPKLKKWGVDLYSISGHKIHGLVGGAALIRSKPLNLEPQVWGGNQEFGLRSGTENILAIHALALAANLAQKEHDSHWEAVKLWAEGFWTQLQTLEPALTRTQGQLILPHILHIQTPGVPGEVLLHHLAAQGVLVSQGSACQANSKHLSMGLKSLGLNDQQIRQSLRLSLSAVELTLSPDQVAQRFSAAIKQVRSV